MIFNIRYIGIFDNVEEMLFTRVVTMAGKIDVMEIVLLQASVASRVDH